MTPSASPRMRESHGRVEQLRVQNEFPVFTQVRRWLEELTEVVRSNGHGG